MATARIPIVQTTYSGGTFYWAALPNETLLVRTATLTSAREQVETEFKKGANFATEAQVKAFLDTYRKNNPTGSSTWEIVDVLDLSAPRENASTYVPTPVKSGDPEYTTSGSGGFNIHVPGPEEVAAQAAASSQPAMNAGFSLPPQAPALLLIVGIGVLAYFLLKDG